MKILVAEDDATSRLMLQSVLSDWGYDVVEAVDGREAWAVLQRPDAPGLVLMDWMMPGMDGLEVIQKVRELYGPPSSMKDMVLRQGPYIIMVTARAEKEDVITCLNAGADDYLSKPFDAEELRARLGVGSRMVELQDRWLMQFRELARTQEMAHLGSWELNGASQEMVWSDEIYRILGLSPQEIPATYNAFLEAAHPDDRAGVDAVHQGSLKDRKNAYEIYYRVLRSKTSDLRYVHGKCVHLLDSSGRLIRSVGMLQDITDLKRAEEAYSRLCNLAKDLICIADIHTASFLQVNPAFEHVLGYSEGELLGRPFLDFIHPEDVAPTRRVVEEKLKKGEEVISFENRYRCKDGSYRYLDWNSHPKPEEGLTFAIAHDITGRKQVEESLRLEHAQLLSVFDSIEEPIYVSDPKTFEILFVNQALRKLLKVNPVGGICYREFQGFQSPCPFCTNEILLKQTPASHHWEHYNPVLDKTFSLHDRIIRWPDGRNVRVELAIDISDRVHAEEEREKLRAQLAQAQKMESVGRLAGGVAHDFNNMLAVILGHAEMALMQTDPAHPLHGRLEQIQATARRSADLVRQLLAFARKQTVAPRVLDLNDTIAAMLKMIRRLIGEDIHLVWMPGARLWPVKMDPSQIDQILANLCVNSRDAIADVGKITMETQNVVLDEAYCAGHAGTIPGEYVLLVVSDDGAGMEKGVLENLFEPFFTTKALGQGTGLGLATVYGIVKQNNGFIHVYSEPGQGTTFRIYLPRYDGKKAPAPVPEPAEALAGGSETILLVEDEPTLLEMGKSMLEAFGYKVLPANRPSQAIHLARDQPDPLHLLITDVVMPEMNGRDLARQLRDSHPHLKCLFMSGYTANVIAQRGVLDPGVHFIQKPFSIQDLAKKVRQVLDEGNG